MNATEVIVGLVVLAGLVYWLRGYGPPAVRALRRARDLVRLVGRVRAAATPAPAPRERRTVEARARGGEPSPAAPTASTGTATVCPACGDRLTGAQLRALRARELRCPGSKRLAIACPFRDERSLN